MIDEDHFPLVALVNIVATDLRAVLNVKKDGRFSPNTSVTPHPPPRRAMGVPHRCKPSILSLNTYILSYGCHTHL